MRKKNEIAKNNELVKIFNAIETTDTTNLVKNRI